VALLLSEKITRLAAIDDHLIVVPVAIMVAIPVDDDCIAIAMFVSFADDGTIPVFVAVVITSCANRHTGRSDTNSNFFRAGGHCCANAGRCGNHDCVFHCVLQMSL
jgi:hypothetical protein